MPSNGDPHTAVAPKVRAALHGRERALRRRRACPAVHRAGRRERGRAFRVQHGHLARRRGGRLRGASPLFGRPLAHVRQHQQFGQHGGACNYSKLGSASLAVPQNCTPSQWITCHKFRTFPPPCPQHDARHSSCTLERIVIFCMHRRASRRCRPRPSPRAGPQAA